MKHVFYPCASIRPIRRLLQWTCNSYSDELTFQTWHFKWCDSCPQVCNNLKKTLPLIPDYLRVVSSERVCHLDSGCRDLGRKLRRILQLLVVLAVQDRQREVLTSLIKGDLQWLTTETRGWGGGHSTMDNILAFTPTGPGFDSWHSQEYFSSCCWDLLTALLKAADRGLIILIEPI